MGDDHLANILATVLDHAYEGIAVVDKDGMIIHFNEGYCRVKGIKQEEAFGQHCTKIIDNTRLHIVLKTGIPERGKLQTISGKKMIVHRIPVWEGNQVIAAIGMLVFEGVTELYHLLEDIEEKEERNETDRLLTYQMKKHGKHLAFEQIIGSSPSIQETKRLAQKAGQTLATVLVTGESGTGKELFARAIHTSSPFSNGKFVSINCGAIPEQLLEAELFGYEEGAFTGAKKGGKPGLFELADKGTLFLDEIGDMPVNMQSKLLRVLQEKETARVGGIESYAANARIIAATNKDIIKMVNEKQFREDLYYRLNIIPLHVPPLRERKEDIPLLLSSMLEETCGRNNLAHKQFTSQATTKLMEYDWPGNIREMMNIVEQLVHLVDKEELDLEDLPKEFHRSNETEREENAGSSSFSYSLKEHKRNEEREIIIQALAEEHGNKSKTAERLGIHRSTLYEKLKKFNIT